MKSGANQKKLNAIDIVYKCAKQTPKKNTHTHTNVQQLKEGKVSLIDQVKLKLTSSPNTTSQNYFAWLIFILLLVFLN